MSTPVEAVGAEGVKALVGQHLGYSDWLEITQERVMQFAEATGDHQWIHTDPERAKAESPFGGPIAHGYLTVSLIPMLLPQVFVQKGFSMGVNYGLDKLRFPSPVPVGSKVRAGVQLDEVGDIAGGVQLHMTVTIEVEGASKPSCVAQVLFRSYE